MNATAIVLAVLGAIGAGAAGYFGYRSVKRQLSGNVQASDAATVFAQMRGLMEDWKQRAERLDELYDKLREDYRVLERKYDEAERRIGDLEEEASASHRIMTALKTEYERMARKVGVDPVSFPDPHETAERKTQGRTT